MATLHRSKHYVSSMPTLEEMQKTNKDLNDWTDILEAKIKQFEQDPKAVIEINRYKQDCRKKSLEFAMQNCGISNPTHDDIIRAANKYYNWLLAMREIN